jgi:hypothetical protein
MYKRGRERERYDIKSITCQNSGIEYLKKSSKVTL